MTQTVYSPPSPLEVERAIAVIDNASAVDVVALMAAACHSACRHHALPHVAARIADESEAVSEAVWAAFEDVQ